MKKQIDITARRSCGNEVMTTKGCKFALKLLADRPRVRYVCLSFSAGVVAVRIYFT